MALKMTELGAFESFTSLCCTESLHSNLIPGQEQLQYVVVEQQASRGSDYVITVSLMSWTRGGLHQTQYLV